jgi:uridine kinase
VNYDHPRSIDWALFKAVLTRCRAGLPVRVPRYDFERHARAEKVDLWRPKRVVLVEGLWLLRRPAIRRLFNFAVFVHCPADLQLKRRIIRDVAERARSEASVRAQYGQTVRPMFERYVRDQADRANVIVKSPVGIRQLHALVRAISRKCL